MPSETADEVRTLLMKRLVEIGEQIDVQRTELDGISGALIALAPDEESRKLLEAASQYEPGDPRSSNPGAGSQPHGRPSR